MEEEIFVHSLSYFDFGEIRPRKFSVSIGGEYAGGMCIIDVADIKKFDILSVNNINVIRKILHPKCLEIIFDDGGCECMWRHLYTNILNRYENNKNLFATIIHYYGHLIKWYTTKTCPDELFPDGKCKYEYVNFSSIYQFDIK